MDQMTPVAQFQQYANALSASAAKQNTTNNTLFFNFDSKAINIPTATKANGTTHPQEKLEWSHAENMNAAAAAAAAVAAIASPNIYQGRHGMAYTPILTGGVYSNFAKGQNYFNFTNAAINEDPQANAIQQQIAISQQQQQQQASSLPTPTPSVAATATALYPMVASSIGGAGTSLQMQEESNLSFPLENQIQFNTFNGNFLQNSAGKTLQSFCGSNSKPNNNSAAVLASLSGAQANSPSTDLLNASMKMNPSFGPTISAFSHQSQFGQPAQTAAAAAAASSSSAQPQNFIQQQQQPASKPIQEQSQPISEGSQVNVATPLQSELRKKPQLSLSLQIPSGNAINPQQATPIISTSHNHNGEAPNSLLPSASVNSTFQNYFSAYPNTLNLAQFTPLPSAAGNVGGIQTTLQQITHHPPLTAQPHSSYLPSSSRNPNPINTHGNPYQDQQNYFFNTQSNYQQHPQTPLIPEQYTLLTPGANTAYGKQQQFFYPNPNEHPQAHTPYANLYDSAPYHNWHVQQQQQQQQQQIQANQAQQMLQQAQQQQTKQEHFQQSTQQLLDQHQSDNNGNNVGQQMNNHDQQKKKPLNLKLDVSMKDNNNYPMFSGIVPSFERSSTSDPKKQSHFPSNMNNNAITPSQMSNNNGNPQSNQLDDDKDTNIIHMLQKNNTAKQQQQQQQLQNNANSFLDAANMSLIIDFYQKANSEKKQQLFDFITNQQKNGEESDKDEQSKQKSQKIIEYIITASTKKIGSLTLQQRLEKIQKYREKRNRRANTSLVKYKKQQIAVSKKPRDKNGKFLKQLDEEIRVSKKIKKTSILAD